MKSETWEYIGVPVIYEVSDLGKSHTIHFDILATPRILKLCQFWKITLEWMKKGFPKTSKHSMPPEDLQPKLSFNTHLNIIIWWWWWLWWWWWWRWCWWRWRWWWWCFLAACCSWGGVGWQSKQLPCVHNPLDEEEQDKWRGVDCDDYWTNNIDYYDKIRKKMVLWRYWRIKV